MDGGPLDGFDRLLTSLEQDAAPRLSLPGMDEPAFATEYVRIILTGAKERGLDFEAAWSMAVNRLQAPADNGLPDPGLEQVLVEERGLLEDARPLWQAAFEGRRATATEKARSVTATWRRNDSTSSRNPAEPRRIIEACPPSTPSPMPLSSPSASPSPRSSSSASPAPTISPRSDSGPRRDPNVQTRGLQPA